ncbi:MAG: phenylalanine--tRNA ligase subunit alpha, partial [Gammaproteobacteria bacterium]|nr:phenylalanine--tRNA ligase subunit alpha [Gammaproteobacteria bacterium]
MNELASLVKQAEAAIEQATDLSVIEQLRVDYLGKKGSITEVMKNLANVAPEDRPKLGQVVNEAKQRVQQAIQAKVDK